MSNKKAILRSSVQWVSGGGGVAKEPAAGGVDAVQAEYRGAEPDSQIDVPDATAANTVYAIPFGTVAGATLLVIENQTGQDVAIALNGGTYDTHLPTGGKLIMASAGLPAAAKVASANVKILATQVGAGTIVGRVFGDPV